MVLWGVPLTGERRLLRRRGVEARASYNTDIQASFCHFVNSFFLLLLLQLRTNYWNTPEAVFEIVGAGIKIPSGFKLLGSNDLILVGPWIGVAICAVVGVCSVDDSMEAKYMVTAHIHVGEKHRKIPVPINFLVAGLENQLVFYWMVAEDLHRIVGSYQMENFHVSFSVEPKGQ